MYTKLVISNESGITDGGKTADNYFGSFVQDRILNTPISAKPKFKSLFEYYAPKCDMQVLLANGSVPRITVVMYSCR
jgi:hypothetical protein